MDFINHGMQHTIYYATFKDAKSFSEHNEETQFPFGVLQNNFFVRFHHKINIVTYFAKRCITDVRQSSKNSTEKAF